MSVGKLILAGKFEEASAEADLEINSVGLERASQKRNKVVALLKMGRLSEAESLCEIIRQRDHYETSFDSVFLGVAQWLQNKREAAIGAWLRATNARFVDAGGGVESRMLLLYASKSQGLPDLEAKALHMLSTLPVLKASLKGPPAPPGWPAPLASFVLGRITENQIMNLLSEYSTEKLQPLMQKYSCQAEFYFGVLCKDALRRKEHFWRAGYDYVPAAYFIAEHHLGLHEFHIVDNAPSR